MKKVLNATIAAVIAVSAISANLGTASAEMILIKPQAWNPGLKAPIKPLKPVIPGVLLPPGKKPPPPKPGKDNDNDLAVGALGLLGGMIIGGAIANATQPAPAYAPTPAYVPAAAIDAHIAWCSGRYRSYNIHDNTWIDLKGRLRNCVSPYLR